MVVPCAFHPLWMEWVPRDAGGGFVRRYALGEAPAGAGPGVIKVKLDNGNEVLRTHYHFVLILNPPDWTQALISMKSTQLKYSQRWNNAVLNMKLEGPKGRFVPPRFAQKFTLNSMVEKNDQGQWYSWQVVPCGLLDLDDAYEAAVYKAAKDFHAAVEKGSIKVADEESHASSGAAASDQEIPF